MVRIHRSAPMADPARPGVRTGASSSAIGRRDLLAAAVAALSGLSVAGCVQASGSGVPGAGNPDRPVSAPPGGSASLSVRTGVAGRVLDEGRRPIAGAVVVPTALPGTDVAIPEIAVVTGPDGRFFWPLPPGDYTITALLNGASVATATVAVPRLGSATVDLIVRG